MKVSFIHFGLPGKMQIKGFLVDLDGVLVSGDDFIPLEGAVEFIDFLKKKNIPFKIATSNSRYSPEELSKILRNVGFNIESTDILSPLSIAPQYLKQKGIKLLFVIGSENLKKYLSEKDFLIKEDENVDGVIVGLDKTLNFEKLKTATTAIKRNKAKLFALNGNRISKDIDNRLFPGVGSVAQMLAYATSCCEKVKHFGKMSDIYNKIAFEELRLKPEETAIVSDDLFVDIAGYKSLGLTGIFLTTGKYTEEDINENNKPDKIYHSLKELIDDLKYAK